MVFGIISAGEGSRLAKEGLTLPKPLVPVCGVPIIERLVRIFMDCDAERISVIVNGESMETVALLKGLAKEMPIELIVKKTSSPMHSLMELAPFLGSDRFCVTTVDTVFSHSRFRTMMDKFSKTSLDGLMGVTSFVDDEKPLYVDADEDMLIRGFLDEQENCRYVSAGIYALKVSALDVLESCLESGHTRMRYFQRQLLDSGMRLKAYDMGQVVDLDHVSDIIKAEKITERE